MAIKSITNQLELAYSPLSNRDFSLLRGDTDIQNNLRSSSLYAICQRPEVSFKNLKPDFGKQTINLEIHQAGNKEILKIELPIFQHNLATDPEKHISLYSGSHQNTPLTNSTTDSIHGIKLYEGDTEGELGRFLVWFSPEKLLQNIWGGEIEAAVEGNIRNFTRYQVHYIGKATDQEIWKRLTGHNTLQDILSLENPFAYGSLPTHEITLLFFSFRENLQMTSFSFDSDLSEVADFLLGNNLPEQKTIFLDAEKALIHAMSPKYNKELFKQYPKSRDGLYEHKYNTITYTFMDPITLVYELGEIRGGTHFLGGDIIAIEDNKNVRLLKSE